jgi:hypothetical protein
VQPDLPGVRIVTTDAPEEQVDRDASPTMNPGGFELDGYPSEDFTRFKRRFHRTFNYVFNRKVKRRVRISKPRQPIPTVLLEWTDKIINSVMGAGRPYITKLNALVYAGAKTIVWFMERRYREVNQDKPNRWFEELTGRIEGLEADISGVSVEIDRRIKQIPLSKTLSDNKFVLIRKYGRMSVGQLNNLKHDLSIKLEIVKRRLSTRIEELDRRRKRKLPPKYAYKGESNLNEEVPVDTTRDFWEKIIGKSSKFKKTDELKSWAKRVRANRKELPELTIQEQSLLFEEVCKKARPWKAPGPDGLHNFWWTHIPSAKNHILRWIVCVYKGEAKLPTWLSAGRTVLLGKGGDPLDPNNYRGITCLNSCYKLLTGMLTRWISRYIECAATLPVEQMALRRGVWGCTHAHILDRVITTDAKGRKKNLSVAWIDFAKAFDSIKHGYLLWCLKQVGIPESLRLILARLMRNWVIRYQGRQDGKIIWSKPLKVLNGVLQGDTLSPLLFCLAIAPISNWLLTNVDRYRTSMGQRDGREIALNHIYFVDDLKIFTTSASELEKGIMGVERIGKAIGLGINCKKCAQAHILTSARLLERGSELAKIPLLGAKESYKYLGIEQNVNVSQDEVFRRLQEVVLQRAESIWSSKRSYGQLIIDSNSMLMSKAKYVYQNLIVGVGRFETTVKSACQLDKQLRRVLINNQGKHKTTSVERLYIDRAQGGFGLLSFVETLEQAVIYAWCYLALRPDLDDAWHILYRLADRNKRNIILDMEHVLESEMYRGDKVKDRILRDYVRPIVWIDNAKYVNPTLAARRICGIIHGIRQRMYCAKWLSAPSQGRILTTPSIDLVRSLRWLTKGHVGRRVVSNIVASQEGMLVTKHFERVHTRNTDGLCRMRCHLMMSGEQAHQETIVHVTSLCRFWRSNLQVLRHNAVAKVLHYYFCRKFGLGTYHYSETPKEVLENDMALLYWDHSIPTEKPLLHNRPDIVIVDKDRGSVFIIEVRVSWPTSIANEERRKFVKYAVNSNLPEEFDMNQAIPVGDNLQNELMQFHKLPVKTVPVVIGVHGEVSVNLFMYLAEVLNIPPKETEELIDRMCRAAAIGTHRLVLAHMANPE